MVMVAFLHDCDLPTDGELSGRCQMRTRSMAREFRELFAMFRDTIDSFDSLQEGNKERARFKGSQQTARTRV